MQNIDLTKTNKTLQNVKIITIITFGDIGIEKSKFHHHKGPIF